MTQAHIGNPVPSQIGDQPTRSAAIRWRVGSAAGQRVFGVSSDRIALEMFVREVENGDWSGTVRVLSEGEESRTINERPLDVRWHVDADLDLLHIDADGFVCATIDTRNGTPRLLYARSGLLGEFGLDGGRYEPESTIIGRTG